MITNDNGTFHQFTGVTNSRSAIQRHEKVLRICAEAVSDDVESDVHEKSEVWRISSVDDAILVWEAEPPEHNY